MGKLYELHDAEKYVGNKDNFFDASHYNHKIGDVLKKQILAGVER